MGAHGSIDGGNHPKGTDEWGEDPMAGARNAGYEGVHPNYKMHLSK